MSPENPLNAERRVLNDPKKDLLSRRGLNNSQNQSRDEHTDKPTTK